MNKFTIGQTYWSPTAEAWFTLIDIKNEGFYIKFHGPTTTKRCVDTYFTKDSDMYKYSTQVRDITNRCDENGKVIE